MSGERASERSLSTPRGEARRGERRALGRRGEELAQAHLARLGFSIIARNARTRQGEIDVIAFKDAALVFVEVKTRTSSAPSQRQRPEQEPLASLRPRQQARLRRLALAWLTQQRDPRVRAHTIRFDAIGVVLDRRGRLLRLEHLEGAW